MSRGFYFGGSSCKHIATTSTIMQELCRRALIIANTRKAYCPDFGISRGYATPQEQNKLFRRGRMPDGKKWRITNIKYVVTYCDGYNILSAHQNKELGAIDFFAIGITGKADYNLGNMALVSTCFYEAASDMGIDIDCGISFKSISDAGHIEIKRIL